MDNRRNPRARWHDYNGGLYFVTVVTRNREHLLGTIDKGIMRLSPVGLLLQKQMLTLERCYPYVTLDRYVIMPNHFHVLIFIDKDKQHSRRSVESVTTLNTQQNRGSYFQEVASSQGALSIVIGGVKSRVTRLARQQGFDCGWQPKFHDHIVRGHDDWMKIANYIDHNVSSWYEDVFNQ